MGDLLVVFYNLVKLHFLQADLSENWSNISDKKINRLKKLVFICTN